MLKFVAMELKDAIERHFSLRAEYGGGGRFLGGFFSRRVLNRQRYWLDGRKDEDVIHEREWQLGPLNLTHRSRNPNIFSREDYEMVLSLFGIFAVSNEQEYLVALKLGPSMGLVKKLAAGVLPARIAAEIADLDLAARAGFRLNLTRLIRDLKGESAESGEGALKEEVDLG
jgi:hypothetical protein